MSEPAEVLECSTYCLEDARRDAAQLHRLKRKAELATGMIDAEIAELQKEMQLLEARRDEILTPIDEEMLFLKNNLTAFHQRELEAGGDKTIKLPYANLKSRIAPQDYDKDDDKLMEWVRVNAPEYVRTEQKLQWGDLKKQIVVAGDLAILQETGEIIDGLAPKAREVKFDVEVL